MRNQTGTLLLLLLVGVALGASAPRESISPVGVAHAGFFIPGHKKRPPGRSPTLPPPFVNPIGIEFVLVPAGSFLMGSQRGDRDEKPPTPIHIIQPFYLGRYEVTHKEWFAVMKSQPWKGRPQAAAGDDYPAVYVNWYQAQAFVQQLNRREHCSCYRLPTEAEWEHAARAGTRTEYSFGDEVARLGAFAWFGANSNGLRGAHPVGRKKPNPWGLYDMHGNVWEWVQDWDPKDIGPRIRGGSWASPASSLRSANRSAWPAGKGGPHIGFRILRVIQY